MADRDIEVVITAADEFSATLQKANEAFGGIAVSANRVERELHKLSSASEFLGSGLRKVRSILENMAFGVVVGAVSAVTQEFINAWQRAFNAEEIMNKLNNTILNQAGSWKILPEPMQAVAQSTIDVYNAQLKLSQFYAVNEIPKLKKEIENLTKANEMASAEIYQNAQLFGPYNAGLFNAATLNQKNHEIILLNNVALAEKRDKLRQVLEIQDLQMTSLEKVNAAAAEKKHFEAMSKTQEIINKANKNYETAESKIRDLDFETAKLGATEEQLIAIEQAKFIATGATIDQIERYTTALRQENEEKQRIAIFQGMRAIESRATEMTEHLKGLSEERQLFSEEELYAIQTQNQQHEWMVQSRAAIHGVAYQAMEQQMLRLVEAGRFSAGEMAKAIMQQVKMELVGIASRATIWAIYETAAGIAASSGPWGLATFGNPAAHFKAAATFAATAAAAMAGAAVVNAITGPGAQRPESGTPGGNPIQTTGSPTALTEGGQQSQPVTINLTVVNPLSDENWAKITEEQIVPYLEKYTSRGGTVNLNVA